MQVETPEVSGEKANTPDFKPGDKVTFVSAQSRGRNVNFSVKETTVVKVLGSTAIVRYRNGQKLAIAVSELTPASERNALTRALCGDKA
ncbi:hypothetical protein [Pseudomonas sp. Irchel 3E13]|uniref:hypothetical protein n=1 Tax=Pseudomonas sp. Irchel 3E13 TaxID=2008975 RepID=UPI000BA2C0FD|nr:hypothetical protein [Pseudomonas sp. Irchel 3E13]